MVLRKNVAASCKAARRVRTHDRDRVRTAARAAGLRLHVSRNKVGPRDGCAGVELVLHRKLLFRRVDLLEVSDARIASARLSGLNKVRNCDRHQNADDQHDDHDFDQGETLSIVILFHC